MLCSLHLEPVLRELRGGEMLGVSHPSPYHRAAADPQRLPWRQEPSLAGHLEQPYRPDGHPRHPSSIGETNRGDERFEGSHTSGHQGEAPGQREATQRLVQYCGERV